MISLQHKNGNIAIFVKAIPLKIETTNKVCDLEMYSLLPVYI